MKLSRILAFTIVSSIFLLGMPVIAQQQSDTRAPQAETKEALVEARTDNQRDIAQSNSTAACDRAQETLKIVLDTSDETKAMYLERYQKPIDILSNITIRINENTDIRTSVIEEDISELNARTADFETVFGRYQAELRSSVNFRCRQNGDTSELKDILANIRTSREELQSTVKTIETYINKDVTQHLEELKLSLQQFEALEEGENA